MGEMVDRIRHLVRHPWRDADDPDGYYADQVAERVAREILVAIREPTEAMRDAGDALPPVEPGAVNTGPFAAEVWRAMIDAALADG